MKSAGSGLDSCPVSFKSGNRHLLTGRSLATEEERNPPIVSIRGCLEKRRRMLKGDEYTGRGSSQRGLGRSPPHKVSVYGMKMAIQHFAEEIRTDQKLGEHLLRLSEGRSVTPGKIRRGGPIFSSSEQTCTTSLRAGLRRWVHPRRRGNEERLGVDRTW